MRTISVRLPDSIHKWPEKLPARIIFPSIKFIASAVAEKLSALTTETYLAGRASRGSVDKFRAALAKVPAVEPDEFDRL